VTTAINLCSDPNTSKLPKKEATVSAHLSEANLSAMPETARVRKLMITRKCRNLGKIVKRCTYFTCGSSITNLPS
jgi:hypothetical protein